MYINLFDSHVHSDNSPEGRDLVTALCSAAVDKGISGICITDAEIRQASDVFLLCCP